MKDRLTNAQISSYRENGFLIIEDFLNGLMVHAANANMTPYPRRAFTCAYMPDHSRFNGIPNVLPERILNTIEIGDLLEDEDQNPLIHTHDPTRESLSGHV